MDSEVSEPGTSEYVKYTAEVYREASLIMERVFDLPLWFTAGTLLGVVRDNGRMIALDDDMDTAYVSPCATPEDAADLAAEVAFTLNKDGLDVHVSQPMRSHLHVHHPDNYGGRIDIFHYFFHDGFLKIPSGVGTEEGGLTEWAGVKASNWEGHPGLSPVQDEELLEHIYGADWRTPIIGSNWNWASRLKRQWTDDGRISMENTEQIEESRPKDRKHREDCEKR